MGDLSWDFISCESFRVFISISVERLLIDFTVGLTILSENTKVKSGLNKCGCGSAALQTTEFVCVCFREDSNLVSSASHREAVKKW